MTAVMLLTTVSPTLASGDINADRRNFIMEKMTERFNKVDQNGDGVLSQEEHKAQADKRFESMDADGDGQITQDERIQFIQKKRTAIKIPLNRITPKN